MQSKHVKSVKPLFKGEQSSIYHTITNISSVFTCVRNSHCKYHNSLKENGLVDKSLSSNVFVFIVLLNWGRLNGYIVSCCRNKRRHIKCHSLRHWPILRLSASPQSRLIPRMERCLPVLNTMGNIENSDRFIFSYDYASIASWNAGFILRWS